ncbi:MAG: helix-turn-helix domain-containing protein, partial [Polyangiaceae bacterium]
FERFNMLLGDSVGPRIAEEGETVVLHRTEPPRIVRLAAFSMAAPLGTVTLLRQLARMGASEQVALDVAFQHPPIPNDLHAAYEKAIGCKVRYSAGDTRLVLPQRLLERPLFAPHPGLFAYLEKHASALQSKVPDSASMAGKVRKLVADRVREGEPEQRTIAKRLGLSERTLQRRLQAENVTFADLVDEVRADLARMYLNDPKLAVFEVAFLLGYSEPSAFNRAFRRWTGLSPSQFRRQGA